jgi:hypothetical protein
MRRVFDEMGDIRRIPSTSTNVKECSFNPFTAKAPEKRGKCGCGIAWDGEFSKTTAIGFLSEKYLKPDI